MGDEPKPSAADVSSDTPGQHSDGPRNEPGFDLEAVVGKLMDDQRIMNELAASPQKPQTEPPVETSEKDRLDAVIAEAERELRSPGPPSSRRHDAETRLEMARHRRRRVKWIAPAVAALVLILTFALLLLTTPWKDDSAATRPGQVAAPAGQDPGAQPRRATGQTNGSATPADESRTWLFTSLPEGWDHYNPDWHIVFAGSLDSGTISMWEDKTVTGTYQASGDKLVIDLTRLVKGTLPQKYHYEMTGYPGETMEGSVMIGRIDPEEPEWPQTVPARAER